MLLGGQNVPNKVEQMSIAKLLISNGCVRERPSINGIQRVVFTRAEAFKADKPSKGE